MKIRQAIATDIPALLRAAESFISESRYGWTFAPEVADDTWRRYLAAPDVEILLAVDGDEVAGGAVVSHDRDFTLQRVGYLMKFYVFPDHRNLRTGRMLAHAVADWFDRHDCWHSFATSTGNIDDAQSHAFTLLMQSVGYRDCGPTLKRTAHE